MTAAGAVDVVTGTPAAGREATAACWANRIPGTEMSAVSATAPPAATVAGATGAASSFRKRAPRGVMVSRSVATGARRAATAASSPTSAAASSRSRPTSSSRVVRQGVACPPKART